MKKILTIILSIKGYSDNTFRPDEILAVRNLWL